MTVPLFHVDAFTAKPFGGNPAAVCILPAPRSDHWLQSVAREMNLSETAFLVRQPEHFDLRWFTPTVEVDLCGHATLASAFVLWQQRYAEPEEPIRFSTRSGILTATRRNDEIDLDFPVKPEHEAAPPSGLLEALGVAAKYVGRNQFDYLIEVESEALLRSVRPNFQRLATIPVRGIIVTSRSSEPRYDFVSRFFAPASGVNEDPVTGSAHCCLGAYWQKRLGKNEFLANQASQRGGVIRVRVVGERVFLGGSAVLVAQGALLVHGEAA